MLALFAILLAAASLSLSAYLAIRLKAVERMLVVPASASNPERVLPERPLQGLRIVLAIEQDHPHPVFVTLLKEALVREDAEVVGSAGDLTISGTLVGNGYADVYYTAELSCQSSQDSLFTLYERPPHGDRPGNLALELVDRLKREIGKTRSQNERASALRELNS